MSASPRTITGAAPDALADRIPEVARRRTGAGLAAWAVLAALMLVAPLVFDSGFAITLLCRIGILVILAASYDLVLGETGMLSFCHAVFAGAGAFAAVHLIERIGDGWAMPVALVPLVGALAGGATGAVVGAALMHRSGVAFAMITLGISELVVAGVNLFPSLFGGEAGITTDRTLGPALFGSELLTGVEVYYLIAAWCLVCLVLMRALRATPLGMLANATRDNARRLRFVGVDPARVRWLMLVASSAFAGIAGALATINYEIATGENFGLALSASVLVAAYIGGIGTLWGPVFGAVLYVVFETVVADATDAWLFYLGCFFMVAVIVAPRGLAGLASDAVTRFGKGAARGRERSSGGVPVVSIVSGTVLVAALVVLTELVYSAALGRGEPVIASLFGTSLDPGRPAVWALVAGVLACAVAMLARGRRPGPSPAASDGSRP